MGVNIAESVKAIQYEKNISEELVLKTIEETLLAAYKRRFGSSDNAVVRFSDDRHHVFLYAKKVIVDDDDWDDPALHIEITEAKGLNEDSEIGDELLIEIDTKTFDRGEVQTAKQKTRSDLREIQKDLLYSEYKDKKGEVVIGYYKRERNGNMYIDLGSTEGMMPKRFQSSRESYKPNDRIKALIWDVSKGPQGLSIILSRTHAEFVKKIIEVEVPEIYDGSVTIDRIVREPGYRTKLAVSSSRDEVDPVGACVGPKGVRIQGVVRELEGEKIDVLRYDDNPEDFIRNALSPAEVQQVILIDSEKRQALAIVDDHQLSLAIGKQGLNVRLANRLVDWSIDVKTRSQFEEMDIEPEVYHSANALFSSNDNDQITAIGQLPGMSERLVYLLRENGIEMIDSLLGLRREDLLAFNGITAEDADTVISIISNDVDIAFEEVDNYECPECGSVITLEMRQCPSCGVDLEFEDEE